MVERWKYILEFGEQRFNLGDEPASIGRSRKCEVAIADPSVSRRHAVLTAQDGSILLEDLGSSNGTFVNRERIQGSIHLRNGDLLALGDAEIRVVVIAAGGLETVRLPLGDVPPELAAELPVGEATSFLQQASVRLAREALGESGDESLPSLPVVNHMAPPTPPKASSAATLSPSTPPPQVPPAAAPPPPAWQAPAAPWSAAEVDAANPLETAQFDPAMLRALTPESPLQTMRLETVSSPATFETPPPEVPDPLQTARFDPAQIPGMAPGTAPGMTPGTAPVDAHQTVRFDPGAPHPVPPPTGPPPRASHAAVASSSLTAPENPFSAQPAPQIPTAPPAGFAEAGPSGLGTEAADISALEASSSFASVAASLDAPPPVASGFEMPNFKPLAPAAEAASLKTPAVETPAWNAPSFETPSFEVPSFETPSFETPSFETPSFETPSFETPSFETPSFEAPSFEAPSFEPEPFETPTFEPVPPVAAPSFAAPAVEPPAPTIPTSQPPPVEEFGFEAPFMGSSVAEPPPTFGKTAASPAGLGQRSEFPPLEVPVPTSAGGDIRDLASQGDLGFGGDMLSSLEGFDTTLGPDSKLPESMQRAQEHMQQLRHEEGTIPSLANPYIPAPPAPAFTQASLVLRVLAAMIDSIWMAGVYFGFAQFAAPINAELGPQLGASVMVIVPVIFSLLVVLVGWGVWGSSPGKRVCGLVIADTEGKAGIGFPRAFIRLLGYVVSTMLLGLGFLMALGSSRRALHDVLAGSQVIKR